MDVNLRDQFDRAVGFDPGADAGAMARTAIARVGRVRRRRKQAAAVAGMAVVLGVAGLVGLRPGGSASVPPARVIAAGMMQVAPSCVVAVDDGDEASDVSIFLAHEVTDRQRSALRVALTEDARMTSVRYESRAEAYANFRVLWADSPDFVAAVAPESLPESFRLRLRDGADYRAVHAKYAAMAGVEQIVGLDCPANAPVGGIR